MKTLEASEPSVSPAALPKPAPELSTLDGPIMIYEVELDSWMRVPEEGNRPLTCAEIAPKLGAYAQRLNFTHVEILCGRERLINRGTAEMKLLTDQLRERNLGVLLDETFEDGTRHGLKWEKDWSRDILSYLGKDPINRKFFHQQIVSQIAPKNAPHFVLPLSHEQVMPGKGSLLGKMAGDDWRKFASLRLLFGCMAAQPGKKLVFMGDEFGQWNEWRPETSLDWHLLNEGGPHAKLQRWVAELNYFYGHEPALHDTDGEAGFEWIDYSDAEESTLAWLRKSAATGEQILAALNFTPVPRHNFRVGAPEGGHWRELLNSDAMEYGGSGQGNLGGVEASPFGWHGQSHSLTITLPPLGLVFFKRSH